MLYAIRNSSRKIPPNLRCMDRKKVKQTTNTMNKIIPLLVTETITETNMLIRVAGNVVAEMMGYRDKPRNENSMPYWRRRIVEKQKVLRKDLG